MKTQIEICANCGHIEGEHKFGFCWDNKEMKFITNVAKFTPQTQPDARKGCGKILGNQVCGANYYFEGITLCPSCQAKNNQNQDDEPETAENSHNAVKTVRRRSPDALRGSKDDFVLNNFVEFINDNPYIDVYKVKEFIRRLKETLDNPPTPFYREPTTNDILFHPIMVKRIIDTLAGDDLI